LLIVGKPLGKGEIEGFVGELFYRAAPPLHDAASRIVAARPNSAMINPVSYMSFAPCFN
jgi:hypothetical protein